MTQRPRINDEFCAFVLASQARLLRFADMLVGERGRAEDLVQHAYMNTYLTWRRREPDDPERYARRIIVHANIDWWRRRPWRERLRAEVPDQPSSADHSADIERRRTVLAALARLTVRERTVVVLRYYCDLTEQDIAAEMDCALGTVKSTAARALGKLKDNPELQQEVARARTI
jgi:RNA polymerase sigma-70 factor (sigma-E family)